MATTAAGTVDTSVRYARSTDGAAIAYRVLSDGPIDLVFNTGLISHVEVPPGLVDRAVRLEDGRFASTG